MRQALVDKQPLAQHMFYQTSGPGRISFQGFPDRFQKLVRIKRLFKGGHRPGNSQMDARQAADDDDRQFFEEIKSLLAEFSSKQGNAVS